MRIGVKKECSIPLCLKIYLVSFLKGFIPDIFELIVSKSGRIDERVMIRMENIGWVVKYGKMYKEINNVNAM